MSKLHWRTMVGWADYRGVAAAEWSTSFAGDEGTWTPAAVFATADLDD